MKTANKWKLNFCLFFFPKMDQRDFFGSERVGKVLVHGHHRGERETEFSLPESSGTSFQLCRRVSSGHDRVGRCTSTKSKQRKRKIMKGTDKERSRQRNNQTKKETEKKIIRQR